MSFSFLTTVVLHILYCVISCLTFAIFTFSHHFMFTDLSMSLTQNVGYVLILDPTLCKDIKLRLLSNVVSHF